MKCPVCDVTLSISSREGVEIDFCPQCRGVWLDRGELDKILDRVAATAPAPGYDARADRDRSDDRPRGGDRYEDRRYESRPPDPRDAQRYDQAPKKKKRRSFLEDIFEFD